MTASTRSTIWTIALVAVFAFLVYKLWPAINAALNGAAGGGSGASGSVTGGSEGIDDEYPPDYYGYQQPQNPFQNLLSGLNLGNLFGGGGSGGGFGSGGGSGSSLINGFTGLSPDSEATDWSQLAESQGWDNSQLLSTDDSGDLSGDQIPVDAGPSEYDFGSWGYSDDGSGGDDDSGDGSGD